MRKIIPSLLFAALAARFAAPAEANIWTARENAMNSSIPSLNVTPP